MTTSSVFVSLAVALIGSGGVVLAALRFNREEAGRVVKQQTAILQDMRTLYELTRQDRDRLRLEVAELKRRVAELEAILDGR